MKMFDSEIEIFLSHQRDILQLKDISVVVTASEKYLNNFDVYYLDTPISQIRTTISFAYRKNVCMSKHLEIRDVTLFSATPTPPPPGGLSNI